MTGIISNAYRILRYLKPLSGSPTYQIYGLHFSTRKFNNSAKKRQVTIDGLLAMLLLPLTAGTVNHEADPTNTHVSALRLSEYAMLELQLCHDYCLKCGL
jgi:hypothetical protein